MCCTTDFGRHHFSFLYNFEKCVILSLRYCCYYFWKKNTIRKYKYLQIDYYSSTYIWLDFRISLSPMSYIYIIPSLVYEIKNCKLSMFKEVTKLNWKVQFSSKVPFFGELWTELSSLFGQVNLNWTEVHFFEWTWTKKIGE